MSLSSLTLLNFIQIVPTCEQSTPLETVIKTFQSGQHDTMVVINEQQIPIGIISSHHLLSYVFQNLLLCLSSPTQTDAIPSISLSLADVSSLIDPLVTVPAQANLTEFVNQWQSYGHEPSNYAVVDTTGKFLGLLDPWTCLQGILTHSPAIFAPSPSVSSPPYIRPLDPLISTLLEQVPIPLTLQTQQEEILWQNASWRDQIGDFLPPDDANACPLSFSQMRAWQSPTVDPDRDEKVHFAAQLSHFQFQEQITDLSPNPPPFLSQSSATLPQITCAPSWQFIKASLTLPDYPLPLWLIVGTEVTEQHRLCQELGAKNADLVQLNRLKDEFLACISHELKSPLTAVVGLSSLLKDQRVGDLNARQVHYADLIYQSGRRLMSLVNDLLDLTRLETGQLKLNPIPINIERICRQAYHVIAEKYDNTVEQPLPFTLEIEPQLTEVMADELRLQQMLVHLLDNAMKFTQDGGEIGLKVNHWDRWIAFTVWDTGIGIPEEAQHLIFQKFQQLENPLTREFQGSGLGLVLTQRLAHAHGGDISFISRGGQGSQFTLLLPPSESVREIPESPLNARLRHSLVLVVEAIPHAVEDISDKLLNLGYRVVVARTGTEAIEKARQLQPYAILLNPWLPLLSGWDVLTLLKAKPITRAIPVVMTTHQQTLPPQSHMAEAMLGLPVDSEALSQILSEIGLIETKKKIDSSRTLTLLLLRPKNDQPIPQPSQFDLALITQLSQFNYRILEADDIEQGAMLAHVWQIDVVIIEGIVLKDPSAYLRSLLQYEQLTPLPLITLEPRITQAASQIPNLSVFPCLSTDSSPKLPQLLQAIERTRR